jgi:hypothetical protein
MTVAVGLRAGALGLSLIQKYVRDVAPKTRMRKNSHDN